MEATEVTVNIPHFTERTNSTLSQYIKDKHGRRCGLVQAFRIDTDYHNEFIINFKNEIFHPYVVIVHSKVRPNTTDKFDSEKAEMINISKAEFMNDYYRGYNTKREKYVTERPSRETLQFYKLMYVRAEKYFKTSDIRMYHDIFEYTKIKDNDSLETIISDIKNENYNMDQLKVLFESMSNVM